MSKIYLAYGSNMNIAQMEYRCPNAKLLGKTVLEGWLLMFRRKRQPVVTIEKESRCSVLVVLMIDYYRSHSILGSNGDLGSNHNVKIKNRKPNLFRLGFCSIRRLGLAFRCSRPETSVVYSAKRKKTSNKTSAGCFSYRQHPLL